MVAALLIKLLGVCEGEMARNDAVRRETDRLISKASASLSYGTCDEDDLESGNCSRCSSSEDLYDENICIVCFDEKRNCFFIPCGHCATCHACAKRCILVFYLVDLWISILIWNMSWHIN